MIYFDNAATYMPKPKKVADALSRSVTEYGNAGRSGHGYSKESSLAVYECRKKLAALFNSSPECVVFTSGATMALNMAIKGTNRFRGVSVISSYEHNAVTRPLEGLRLRGETVVRHFRVDNKSDLATVDNFASVCSGASNIIVTHASNVCGRLLPIKELRTVAPKDSVFILDASQTAGHIPIDIKALGVDMICVPGHKGLKGPMGIGALIINPFSDIEIEPILEGGTGVMSKSLAMPKNYPEKLEPGTLNIPGISGLSAALDCFSYPKNEALLFKKLVNGMSKIKGVKLYGLPDDLSFCLPVLLFNIKGLDSEYVADALYKKGFAVRAGYHCAPLAHKTLGTYNAGGVRVSLSDGNTEEEILSFLSAVSEIAENR